MKFVQWSMILKCKRTGAYKGVLWFYNDGTIERAFVPQPTSRRKH